MQYFGKYPATIASYTSATRRVTVHIDGLTEGSETGLPATFCLPIGENDRDTEILINVGDEVWVEFEKGDPSAPIIVGYRTHTTGVTVGIRRLRQVKIEVLATNTVRIFGATKVVIDSTDVEISATSKIKLSANIVSVNGA